MTRREQIIASLGDKEYRDAFVAEHVDTGLAFQIRAMRDARKWSQEELGQRAGMAQERISVIEDPDYGRHTLSTLKRLASAFDVALAVRFVPFSQLADWAADISPEDLAIPEVALVEVAMIPREMLRASRERLGLSRSELAKLLQMPPDTLRAWESGERLIRHPHLLKLALERLEALAELERGLEVRSR